MGGGGRVVVLLGNLNMERSRQQADIHDCKRSKSKGNSCKDLNNLTGSRGCCSC